MIQDEECIDVLILLKRVRYTVQQEMELYHAFKFLSKKYKNVFFDWYLNIQKNYDLPEIIYPKNDMEDDIKKLKENIMKPKTYTFEQICEFEKKVCEYLATNLTRSITKNYKHSSYYLQLEKYLNRYEAYRPFYLTGFEIEISHDLNVYS